MREGLKSRFLTIGFSSDHDAPFMNKIAQSGSDLGNFMYIDTGKPNYSDDVQTCLAESLDMAMQAGGVKLCLSDGLKLDAEHKVEISYSFADEDVDGIPVITGVTLTCQVIMETKDVQGLAAKLTCKDNSRNYSVVSIEVSEPSEEIRLQALLKNANKQIFELIQKVQ